MYFNSEAGCCWICILEHQAQTLVIGWRSGGRACFKALSSGVFDMAIMLCIS
jgi:hypothetical protein